MFRLFITNKILATDEVVFNLYVAKYKMTVQLITVTVQLSGGLHLYSYG